MTKEDIKIIVALSVMNLFLMFVTAVVYLLKIA
jgi:hypothetical protein